MLSDKHNTEMAEATGLISSLISVALYRYVLFHQLKQLQYMHHRATLVFLISSLCSLSFPIKVLNCIAYLNLYYIFWCSTYSFKNRELYRNNFCMHKCK